MLWSFQFILLVVAICAIGLPGMALAAPAGTVATVRGSAQANGPEGARSLAAGSAVFRGDTVSTGLFGHVEITFSDETRLAIGPNAALTIDNYLLGGGNRASAFAINATHGAFRFLTGRSRKAVYDISSPSVTIGIRGTEFDFTVRGGTRTAALLYGGAIEACAGADCVNLTSECSYAILGSGQRERGLSRTLAVQTAGYWFPFAVDEARLSPPYRLDAARCVDGQAANTGPTGGGGADGRDTGRGDGQGG